MVDKYQFYNVTKFFPTNRLLPDLEKNIFHVRFINENNFAEICLSPLAVKLILNHTLLIQVTSATQPFLVSSRRSVA